MAKPEIEYFETKVSVKNLPASVCREHGGVIERDGTCTLKLAIDPSKPNRAKAVEIAEERHRGLQ